MFQKFLFCFLGVALMAMSGCDKGKCNGSNCDAKACCCTDDAKACTCGKDASCCTTDTTAAVLINGKVAITVAELDKALDRSVAEMAARYGFRPEQLPPEQVASLKASMTEQVIEEYTIQKLVFAECDRLKISVSETDVDEAIAQGMEQAPPGVTLDDIAAEQGLTAKDIRDSIRNNFRAQKLISDCTGTIAPPTDKDLQDLFDEFVAQNPSAATIPEQVRARHILVMARSNSSSDEERADARKKCEAIRDDLLNGADFATVAAEVSDCPSGKSSGGDLGLFPRGMMDPAFEKAAFSQELNVIGEVVESSFGYHIIQVTEQVAAGTRTWESEREDLARAYPNKVRSERIMAYIAGLKKAAKIEVVYKAPAFTPSYAAECDDDFCDVTLPDAESPAHPAESPVEEPSKPLPGWAQ